MVFVTPRKRDRHYLSTPLPFLSPGGRNRSIATSRPSIFEHGIASKPWTNRRSSSYPSRNFYTEYAKAMEIHDGSRISWKHLACVILCLAPWIPVHGHYNNVQNERQIVDNAIEEHYMLADELHNLADEITSAKKELRESKERNDDSYNSLKELHGALDLENDKYLAAEEMEEVLLQRIDRVERLVQKFDSEDLEMK